VELNTFNLENQMDLELSKNSFAYFFEHMLDWQMAGHQLEWLELMETTNRTVIVCSRGHGKSVFMHSWVVWNLCFREPPYQMVYMSSNQKQTNMHMKDIEKLFNHPALQQFKPKGSKGWAVEELNLVNGNSLLSRSVNSQFRGLHPNEVIIDDPLKEFSLAGINKVTDWFFGDLVPAIHHTASLRIIGTPFSYTDIYQQLGENDVYTVRRYPCFNALNEPLWKERWDYDALMSRKAEIGSLKFTREYMCVPISTGTSLFNPEYLDGAKNKDLVLSPMRREGYKYYVGIDPAISTDGDYNVITVLEVDDEDNKSIVYVDRAKNVQFRENLDKVRLIGKIFNPEVMLFETNVFAKSFTQELRNISDVNVHDFTTTRKKKQDIILNLQMNFENNKIHLPYGNEESRRVTSALIEELSMFAISERGKFEGVGAHDDMVMSLALANAATQRVNENFLLLDDLGIFNEKPNNPLHPMNGIVGLNF
jgi:hypothetical protein|tara:strand:- start:7494 stop:8930 length:1437 start_codon:yes stop_codon:yes gene_type:complete